MKKLLVIFVCMLSFSSCYDLKEHSLERSADYSEQNVELMRQQVDQLRRIADAIELRNRLDSLVEMKQYIWK